MFKLGVLNVLLTIFFVWDCICFLIMICIGMCLVVVGGGVSYYLNVKFGMIMVKSSK